MTCVRHLCATLDVCLPNILGAEDMTAYMQVKEIAIKAGVTADAVRYYTQFGLLKPTRESSNKYRIYSRSDLIRLNFIRRARTLGFTLAEIGEILRASEKAQSPCPLVRKVITERIAANRKHMQQAMALQRRMEDAAKRWKSLPDAVPVGDSICDLIEQATNAIKS